MMVWVLSPILKKIYKYNVASASSTHVAFLIVERLLPQVALSLRLAVPSPLVPASQRFEEFITGGKASSVFIIKGLIN